MTTIVLILSLIISLLLILMLLMLLNNNKLKNEITTFKNEINNIIKELNKPLRKGYIIQKLSIVGGIGGKTNSKKPFESYIYVTELDRYNNGESKIKVENIECGIDNDNYDNKKVKEYILGNMKSIVKTTDVIWFDSVTEVKELRKAKLEILNRTLKND